MLDTYLTFLTNHPFLGIFITVVAYYAVTAPFRYMVLAYNRRLRSQNIHAMGWPPAHLDADGDFKQKD